MVLFGQSSGPVAPIDPQLLNRKGSLFLTRPTLAHYVATRDELLARAGDLFSWIADGELDVRIGAEFPLAEAARGAPRARGKADYREGRAGAVSRRVSLSDAAGSPPSTPAPRPVPVTRSTSA